MKLETDGRKRFTLVWLPIFMIVTVFLLSLYDLFDPGRNEPNIVGNLFYGFVVVISMVALVLGSEDSNVFRLMNFLIWSSYLVFTVSAYIDWEFQSRGDFGSIFLTVGFIGIVLMMTTSTIYGVIGFARSRMESITVLSATVLSSFVFIYRPLSNFESGPWMFILFYLTIYAVKATTRHSRNDLGTANS